MKQIFVVTSHLLVEKNNWSSEVVKAFIKREDAETFAQKLSTQAERDGSAETIEVSTIELIGD